MRLYELLADASRVGMSATDLDTLYGLATPLLAETNTVASKWPSMHFSPQSLQGFHDPDERTKAQSKKLHSLGPADCSGMPMLFSGRAVDCLKHLFEPTGEFLPVETDEQYGEYFVYHCMFCSDALDEEKSECKYYREGGIDYAIRYVFDPSKIQHPVFRLSCFLHPRTWLYVTNEVVDLVDKHNLSGFSFTELWSD